MSEDQTQDVQTDAPVENAEAQVETPAVDADKAETTEGAEQAAE